MNIKEYNKPRYDEKKAAFKWYKRRVKKLSEIVAKNVPGIEKRKWREWDLDHIIPIKFGFTNNIPPENIALLSNLRIITHEENTKKGNKVLHSLKHIGLEDGTIQIKRKRSYNPIYLGGYYIPTVS